MSDTGNAAAFRCTRCGRVTAGHPCTCQPADDLRDAPRCVRCGLLPAGHPAATTACACPSEEPRSYSMQRRALEDGWIEIRIITRAAPGTTARDFKATGMAARKRITKYVLANAAGVALAMGLPELNQLLHDVWQACEARAFGMEGN